MGEAALPDVSGGAVRCFKPSQTPPGEGKYAVQSVFFRFACAP